MWGNVMYTAAGMFGGLYYWRISRVALITIGCLSFLVGVGLAAIWQVTTPWLLAGAGLFVLCRSRKVVIALPIVILAGSCTGLWRGSVEHSQLAHYAPVVGQKVTVQGTVAEDPTYGDDHQQVMLLQNIRINGQALPGQVRVKSLAPVEPQRADVVTAFGKLYAGFGNYQASLYYADLHIIGVAHDPINTLRHWFGARVHSLLPDTQAGLGLGFVVGIKSELPDLLNNQLKILGLTHIVVASGYNLTILVRLARRLFAKRSHYQMTIVALGLICGFVLITGFSPSMGRAALVSGLSVWAWYYGRRIHPALLISLTAAITAAINPLYVWGDLGWWLSFLSFAGVMLLAPLLQRRIFNQKQPKLIGQVVLETVCAQIMTLPLMVLMFGNISILSLLANVLVVPLIPLAMLLTALCAIIPPVAWLAMWPLGYICQLVQLLAQVSWASVPLTISPSIMVSVYVAIAGSGLLLWRRTKHDYLRQSVIE